MIDFNLPVLSEHLQMQIHVLAEVGGPAGI